MLSARVKMLHFCDSNRIILTLDFLVLFCMVFFPLPLRHNTLGFYGLFIYVYVCVKIYIHFTLILKVSTKNIYHSNNVSNLFLSNWSLVRGNCFLTKMQPVYVALCGVVYHRKMCNPKTSGSYVVIKWYWPVWDQTPTQERKRWPHIWGKLYSCYKRK